MELWQRFTHSARRCILNAHEEQTDRAPGLIGTEHLLLGMLCVERSRGVEILRSLDVDLLSLRNRLTKAADRIGRESGEKPPQNEIAFSHEAQRVLQVAWAEARQLGHDHIGTEHLLLGLVREPRGAAFGTLGKYGVTDEKVRQAILALEEGDEPPAGARAAVVGSTGSRAEAVAVAARELLDRAHRAAADMRRHLEQAEGLIEQIGELLEEDYSETGSVSMDRQTLSSDRIPPAVGPYSQAVRAGNMLFCSGIIGLDPETKQLVDDSFEAQVRRLMENLRMLLEDCGSDLPAIVKTTVFLTDMDRFSAFNEIYAEFFGDEPPARSTIQVAALPLGAQIEVEAIAIA